MNPLSVMLNKIKYGNKIGNSDQKISHLIYMDDVKVMRKSKE